MPPITRSVLSMPSTMFVLLFSGAPLIDAAEVWRRSSGRLPLRVARADPSLAPGCICTRFMMLRPRIGVFCTVSSDSVDDTCEESV